jgi:hypothetical protein
LRGGFRLASEDSTDDVSVLPAGWDPEGINGTDHWRMVVGGFKSSNDAKEFEPATPMAGRFVSKVWPFYDRLFRSSVKQAGTDVTFNQFVAITNATIELVSLIRDMLHLKWLAETPASESWSQMQNVFGIVHKLHNKSFERRLENIIGIASGLPAIKGIISETVRMKTAFIPVGGEGSMVIPYESSLSGGTVSSTSFSVEFCLARIEAILSALRGDYADEVAAMKRHMPYTLADTNFVALAPTVVDPFKSDGVINSDMTYNNTAGNNGDESTVNALVINEEADTISFIPYGASQDMSGIDVTNELHTVVPGGMPLLSFLSASIWIADNDLVDKDFALLTPHLWGNAYIPYDIQTGGISYYTQDSNVIAEDYSHLRGPLSMQLSVQGSETFYFPYGRRTRVDLDACLNGLYMFTDQLGDISVVGGIDELGKTAFAPVVHPAIDAVRR